MNVEKEVKTMIGDICIVGVSSWKTQQNARHFVTALAKCLVILQA